MNTPFFLTFLMRQKHQWFILWQYPLLIALQISPFSAGYNSQSDNPDKIPELKVILEPEEWLMT
jgi:hypothetical protein